MQCNVIISFFARNITNIRCKSIVWSIFRKDRLFQCTCLFYNLLSLFSWQFVFVWSYYSIVVFRSQAAVCPFFRLHRPLSRRPSEPIDLLPERISPPSGLLAEVFQRFFRILQTHRNRRKIIVQTLF